MSSSIVHDGKPHPRQSRADLEQWFDALMAAHGPALGRLASSYARGKGEREDLLQDIVPYVRVSYRAQPRDCTPRPAAADDG